MCKNIIYLMSVLVLSVICTGYADEVIGDWEDGSYDGWIDWGAGQVTIESIGEPKYSFSPIGATLGSSALKVSPGSGWQQNLSISLADIGAMDAFLANKAFSIDVTYNSADWDPATTYAQVYQVSFNNDGFGWHDVGGSAAPNGTAGVVFTDTLNPDSPGALPLINPGIEGTTITGTWTWDYSGVIDQFENPSYIQIVIATNSNAPGAYYFDNARLVGSGNLRAENPSPEDAATDLRRDPTLVWKRGTNIETHNIYIGTNFSDVNDATEDVHPNVIFAQSDVNNFTPGNLEFDTTYYWRVDEVNGTDIWRGPVWSFTVGHYLVVDDFESYNDINPDQPGSNRIFLAWVDGYGTTDNGALVGNEIPPFAERAIVHGGSQAMPFFYDDNMKYSEAKKTLTQQRDWTEAGMRALSLWFYGNPDNSPEPMYVAIANNTGPSAVVNFPDSSALQVAVWHQWTIDLSLFAEDGIDLTDVNSIAIGFGNKNNLQAGGSGEVIFDDIRLYPPRCILSERTAEFARLDFMPLGNPAGDCVIDYLELEIMARDWLVMDEVIATTPPGTSGLVANYQFETGTGTLAADTSGNNHSGTLTAGGISWISPGIMNSNSAVHFDGYTAGSRISIGTWNPAAGTNQLTLALWINWAGPRDPAQGQPQGLICKRDGWSADDLMFMFEMDTPDSADTRGAVGLRQYSSAGTDVYSEAHVMDQFIGRWAHVAAVFDGTTARLYLNGSEIASGPFSFANGTGAGMTIGNNNSDSWPDCPGVFNGDMDDVRIYNRALTPAQVAYLADTTPADGELHSVPSLAELFEAGDQSTLVVNFRDFAVLANHWLEKMLWP
jgi:hypothetical protein